jgi:hypothetical protein
VKELSLSNSLDVSDLSHLIWTGMGVLMFVGSFSFLWNQGVSPTVYVFGVLYFGALLLWPWRSPRFLYPIQPFLFWHLIQGVRLMASQPGRVRGFPAGIVRALTVSGMTAVIAALLGVAIYRGMTDEENARRHVRDFRVGTTWLKENSPEDALIMAQQPQSIYLYARRKTVNYGDIATADDLERVIQQQGIDYILVAPELIWRGDGALTYDAYTRDTLLPLLNTLASAGQLRVAYTAEKDLVQIFQTRP